MNREFRVPVWSLPHSYDTDVAADNVCPAIRKARPQFSCTPRQLASLGLRLVVFTLSKASIHGSSGIAKQFKWCPRQRPRYGQLCFRWPILHPDRRLDLAY